MSRRDPSVLPIDAETRGRLRRFKVTLSARYARLDRLLEQRVLVADASHLAMKNSLVGRQRAWKRLQRAIAPTGAILEGLRLHGNWPLAVWSILKPRDSIRIESDRPGDMQDCVVVNYLMCGRHPEGDCQSDGNWTLEAQDHALGRLLQRDPKCDPALVLNAAHRATLRLKSSDVLPNAKVLRSDSFLVPAGNGAFVSQFRLGEDASLKGNFVAHIVARTWLEQDMLHDNQMPLYDDGE